MKPPSRKASPALEKYFIKKPPEFTKAMARRGAKPMNTLLRITQLIGNHLDLELSLMTLMDLASELAPYEWALFYLWEEEKGALRLREARGINTVFPPVLEKGNLIARWTIQHAKPVFIPADAAKEMEPYFSTLGTFSMISVPILINNHVIGILQLGSGKNQPFVEEDALLIWMLAIQAQTIFDNTRVEREFLRKMAMTDGLTSLFNRRYFDEQVDHEIQRSHRTGKPFVLMMFDVDFFKKYNDRYKHLKGDQALREIAMVLKARLRQIDTVARFGGEEFAALLPETGEVGGLAVARQISHSIKNHLFIGKDKTRDVRMTISIGVSIYPQDGTTQETLVHRADLALYQAKESGRDQVFTFSQLKNPASNKNSKEEQNVF